MNYRELLREVSGLKPITSRAVAIRLVRPVKRISNDLYRLHKMGFLVGHREKRAVCLKQGRICHRGFENVYSFTKQGKSYLKWMNEVKPFEDFACMDFMNKVMSNLPQELRQSMLAYYLAKGALKYKGPSSRGLLFDDAAAAIAILQIENRRLTEENLAQSAAHMKTCMEYENKILECNNKIEETKREDMKAFLDYASETVKSDKAERQHHEQTVNMFADILKAIVSGYVDLGNIAMVALRKHAPVAEYANTVERITDVTRSICDRTTLDVSLLKSLEAHGLA